MQKNDLTKLETDEPDSEYDAKTVSIKYFLWKVSYILSAFLLHFILI